MAHGQIVRCAVCGFVFTNPQFSPEEYNDIYKMAPAATDSDHTLETASRVRFRHIARIVKRYVDNGPFLDFGCGSGGFLDVMNEDLGIGFEVDSVGERQSISGHRIITGQFLDLVGREPLSNEAFSFVTAFDVFEHIPNLSQHIEALSCLIRNHGYLVVTVPNIESTVARLAGERWNMILLEHLWYFSPKTLRQIVEPHGFEHISTQSLPYATSLSHLLKRMAETYQINLPSLPRRIGCLVVPIPIGLMLSIFRRI
jgi:2-polyprenyl-3-methyl-5-hydroxy-6-metoxy-1,4-benzoquinol methylase